MSFEKGEIVGDYKICKYLERGASSQIYKIKNLYSSEVFACKIIKNKHYNNNEVNIHKKLNHQNIVNFFKNFEFDGYNFIVLELCDIDLYTVVIKNSKKLNLRLIKKWSKELLNAIQYLHENKVMHRDIKLENVLLKREIYQGDNFIPLEVFQDLHPLQGYENFDVKLSDFGLSTIFFGKSSYGFSGTLHYLSPEILDELYDEKTDIWSFGIVLYEILFDGRSPFDDINSYEVMQNIREGTFSFPTNYSLNEKDFEKACFLLNKILVSDDKRISIKEILEDEFLK